MGITLYNYLILQKRDVGVAVPYNYFVYVSATLSTVKGDRRNDGHLILITS